MNLTCFQMLCGGVVATLGTWFFGPRVTFSDESPEDAAKPRLVRFVFAAGALVFGNFVNVATGFAVGATGISWLASLAEFLKNFGYGGAATSVALGLAFAVLASIEEGLKMRR